MVTFCRRVALVLLAILMLAVTPLSHAQDEADSPMDEAGPFALPYSGRNLSALIKIVGFDADQTASARSLHQGYRGAYTAVGKKAKRQHEELNKKMQESQDWTKFRKEQSVLVLAYVEDVRKLEAGLLDDLKSLCTPAQAAKFPAAERTRRRDTGLLMAVGNGERVDLIAMLDSLKIDRTAPPALAEVINHWELDLDRLLIEKDKVLREGMKNMMGMEGMEESMDKIRKFGQDLCAIANRAGECNRRAATEALALLPDSKKAIFEQEVKLRTYPRIYGPSQVNKSIKSALAIKDLSAEQKAKIKDLSDAYDREVAPINTRWAAAAEEKQRQLADHFMEMMQENEDNAKDAFFAARKERHALDEKYQTKLNEILTPDQKDQLPKPPESNHGIPEYLPDFEADFKGEWEQWKGEGG